MTRKNFKGLLAALGMLFLILDAKTAIAGASEGVILCMRSVIPSLFPFFLLSILLTGAMTGTRIPIMAPVARFCGIPAGGESLLLTGLLGGYPVGAQAVAQCWKAGNLSRRDAGRLLGFCSNAGPSFLFGIIGMQFSNMRTVWTLWFIHILSALAVGALLPGKSRDQVRLQPGQSPTVSDAFQRSLKITGAVCGWVILFRAVLGILSRWCLWLLPDWGQVLTAGLLELTNGCCDLSRIPAEELRFTVCTILLSLGGLCVAMQTLSVTGSLGLGLYIPGKLLQCGISFILAQLALPFLFGARFSLLPVLGAGVLVIGSLVILGKYEKRGSIPALVGV